jgi:uncharacterized protein with FMN-binding domain
MLRAVLALVGTAAGLAALLSFKTHSAADASAAATPGTMSSPAPSPTLAAGGGGKASPSASAMASGSRGTSAGSATTRTVTGTVASTQYGPMQVQLVLTGKRISAVNILQKTNDGQESVQIDSTAIPKLTSETLTAQSAHIDAVSGATYTTQGYIQSLQSALDKAAI